MAYMTCACSSAGGSSDLGVVCHRAELILPATIYPQPKQGPDKPRITLNQASSAADLGLGVVLGSMSLGSS